MRKVIENLRVLVCGYSEAHYPRDETIIAALRQLPLKRLYDLRVTDDFWVKRHSGQDASPQNLRPDVNRRFSWANLKIQSLILTRQVDLVLVMKWNEELLPQICRWAQQAKIPVVYDLWVSRYILAQRNGKRLKYWQQLEANILQRGIHLLALTQPYKDFYLQTYDASPEQISVLPLGVDDLWLRHPPEAMPHHDRFHVTYWGNVHKHHGVDIALEAARLLQDYPHIQFWFCGSVKMQTLLQTITPTPNVKFLGWVNGLTELIQTVDQSDLCFGHLSPTHDSHLVLPNKAMEGMARGKVVLHAKQPEMLDLYANPSDHEAAVWFFDGGAEGLAKTILELSQSATVRQAIGDRAREMILAHHSVSSISNVFRDIIERL